VEIHQNYKTKLLMLFPRSANVLKKQSTTEPLFLPQVAILKSRYFFSSQILPGVNLTVVRTYYISSA